MYLSWVPDRNYRQYARSRDRDLGLRALHDYSYPYPYPFYGPEYGYGYGFGLTESGSQEGTSPQWPQLRVFGSPLRSVLYDRSLFLLPPSIPYTVRMVTFANGRVVSSSTWCRPYRCSKILSRSDKERFSVAARPAMAYRSFRKFLDALEQAGELTRVAVPVDTDLLVAEWANREMKSPGGGKALFFEQPIIDGKKSAFPVAINTMGSRRRMALALQVADIGDIAQEIQLILKAKPPTDLREGWSLLKQGIHSCMRVPRRSRKGLPGSRADTGYWIYRFHAVRSSYS